ncbi:hypothetical protein [Streptomyces sp. 3214.6]|uniref:hypothetical protein n=1 Tax=Streptomyces sp. 3214.6 TaxID=1882757 RepID=UPI00090C1F24|nr:hypothetical protein [Streptomyces sp. 3214.6]SHI24569.1 hypothetical protein SAMN05444521_6065 [Streptomyces sp. 3214.6]
MGMSLLYQVLEPLPDAVSALRRARGLLGALTEWAEEPFAPEVGPVVTVDQFHYARRYFTWGDVERRDGSPLPPDGLAEFWHVLARTDAVRGRDAYRVEVELRPEIAEVWPLLEERGLQLSLPGWSTPPFRGRGPDECCPEAELDLMVQAVGPLGFDVSWEGSLRGLPSSKLCGVQLCLNSVWTDQCTEPAPGTHAVYLSIGTRNRDVQEEWLEGTGLSLGPAVVGW